MFELAQKTTTTLCCEQDVQQAAALHILRLGHGREVQTAADD